MERIREFVTFNKVGMVLKRNLKNNGGYVVNVELAYFDLSQDLIWCFSSETICAF